MAEFPALPLFTDAYLGDTTHLSTFEHGAYLLLLIVSWRSSGCCVADDDALLARYTRMTRDKWRKIRPILEPFFNGRMAAFGTKPDCKMNSSICKAGGSSKSQPGMPAR
jgi:uncharacterized protein YdaU (DUF1376 family)